MSISLVQKQTTAFDADASPAITLTSTPTDGNLLILGILTLGSATGLTAPTGGGNTWTLVRNEAYDTTSTKPRVAVWYKLASSDSTTHEITGNAVTDSVVFLAEYSSTTGWATTPLDTSNGANSATSLVTSQTTGSVTTTATDCLLVGFGGTDHYDSTTATCATNSFTTQGSQFGNSTYFRIAAWGDRIVAATGTYSTDVAWDTTSSEGAAVIAAFAAGTSTPATVNQPPTSILADTPPRSFSAIAVNVTPKPVDTVGSAAAATVTTTGGSTPATVNAAAATTTSTTVGGQVTTVTPPGVQFDTDTTLLVEVAFSDNPLTVSPTWTDISTYVRRVTIRRGRSHELDQIRASTADLILDNRDGRFDPSNTAGAYYPNVQPMKQIRMSAIYDGTTYRLFRGMITAWPQQWPARVDATVPLHAVDGFRLLNQIYTANPQVKESSGTRIGNLLDDASWPTTWRNLAAGDVTVQAYTPSCESVLSLIRNIVDTEAGLFFIDGSGNAIFQARSYRSGLTSTATFGDAAGELDYTNLTLGYDDTQVWNRIEVTRRGGATVAAENTTSQASYGKRVLKLYDLLHVSDADGSSLASALLVRYKDPQIRVKTMTVAPRSDPTNLWPQVLGLELSDLVTVKRRPPAGNTISQDVHVEGVTHTADARAKSWTTRFELSPYS